MTARIDTVIIGAGQAGLSMSYWLRQQGREHIVLERDQVGSTWKKQRWDSFRLVTQNWQLQLPGYSYRGDEPEAFAGRDEVIRYLETYAAQFDPPIHTGINVRRVTRAADGARYNIEADDMSYEANHVVMANGAFPIPWIPPLARKLPPHITQLHASEYRAPDVLPAGGVLVVGSGQSGTQIAHELASHGRRVYLSVGSSLRGMRHYRGRDSTWWLQQAGEYDRTVDEKRAANEPIASTPYLGIDLIETARKTGMVLVGRILDTDGRALMLARNLNERLRKANQFLNMMMDRFDALAERLRLPLTAGPEPRLLVPPELDEPMLLSLRDADIRTIIWSTGYRYDQALIPLPIWDEQGKPLQRRGVTPLPGLYFLGLYFMHTLKSGLLFGVGEDAEFLASHIEASARQRRI